MSSFSSRWLDYAPPTEKVSDIPKNATDKTDKSSQPTLPPAVSPDAETLPRLPWQLERLVSAAASGVLPDGTVMLSAGLVPDLGRYVLGWAASYLVGDRQEAERRLWQVYRAWQGVN